MLTIRWFVHTFPQNLQKITDKFRKKNTYFIKYDSFKAKNTIIFVPKTYFIAHANNDIKIQIMPSRALLKRMVQNPIYFSSRVYVKHDKFNSKNMYI